MSNELRKVGDSTAKIAGNRGMGRKPGVPNRITASVKGMLLEALDEVGGKEYLILQAEKNPTAFLALIAKLIPSEVKAEVAPAPALFSEDQLLRVAEEIRRKREQATA